MIHKEWDVQYTNSLFLMCASVEKDLDTAYEGLERVINSFLYMKGDFSKWLYIIVPPAKKKKWPGTRLKLSIMRYGDLCVQTTHKSRYQTFLIRPAPVCWFLVSHQVLLLHTMRVGMYYHYVFIYSQQISSQKKLTNKWSVSIICQPLRSVLLDAVQ